jgi:MYXO-CTERM domain-containing protein
VQNRAESRFRRWLVVFLGLGLFLLSGSALAAGRVEWKDKAPKEREGGSWRLELAIFLNSPPDVAHVPMKFEFQPIAYYERSMVDGDKLIERTVPLEHRQSLIESVDVGFLDSGSGKIEKRTRFTFKVTRAHGYEAGEYKVTIKDSRNGATVGTPTTLKLNGQNEVIDRRAMVFTGEKKKKPAEDKAAADKAAADKTAEDSSSAESDAAEPAAPSEDSAAADSPEESSNAADAPPAIEEKPGAGCHLVGSSTPATLPALGALGLVLALSFRRRRQRAAT